MITKSLSFHLGPRQGSLNANYYHLKGLTKTCFLNLTKTELLVNQQAGSRPSGPVGWAEEPLGLECTGSPSAPKTRPGLAAFRSNELPEGRGPVFSSCWNSSQSVQARETVHILWLVSRRSGTQNQSPFSKSIQVGKMRVPQSKVTGKQEGRCLDPRACGSDGDLSPVTRRYKQSCAWETQFHSPRPPVSSFQKEIARVWAAFSTELSQYSTPTQEQSGRPWLIHTCWPINKSWTHCALSFRETTAWFGAWARLQVLYWSTSFWVPSRHSSLKFPCFRSLAHGSGLFPRERKGGSALFEGFGQGALWGDVVDCM